MVITMIFRKLNQGNYIPSHSVDNVSETASMNGSAAQSSNGTNVSFTQLTMSPNMSRREVQKPTLPTPPPKQEITVRTPETKNFDINWDQQPPPRVNSQLSNGRLGSVESLDISQTESKVERQPDLVIDFDRRKSF